MLFSCFQKEKTEAGCDEAGRGCLAGPVVAAAVILPGDYTHEVLIDSKQLTSKQRIALKGAIIKDAIAWGIGVASPGEIDAINILNASHLAMHRAIEQLKVQPGLLLIDGNSFKPYQDVPCECIIRGDENFYSIAAASVLAKTYRDGLMKQLAIAFPGYGWETNFGYPTRQHQAGIRRLGVTNHHRMTFRLLPEWDRPDKVSK